MKSLLVAAFTICSCAFVSAQQAEIPSESQIIQPPTEAVVSSDIPPEPMFVISEGGIKKEASKEDLEKISITQIESVEVLLDSESIREYGEKARNGVMVISLREE